MKSFEEYITDKKNTYKRNVADKLADELMPRPKGEPRKAFAKKVNAYKCTSGFQKKLDEKCEKDVTYHLLNSIETAKSDEKLQAEYEKYVFEEEYTALGEEWDKRIDDFIAYIIRKEEMLVPLAQQMAEEAAAAEKEDLRSERQYITAHDFDYPYHWDRKKYTEVTADTVDDFFSYYNEEARDLDWEIQILEDANPLGSILEYLEENDSEEFETEKAKMAKGFTRFSNDHLAAAIHDSFFDGCLYDNIDTFYKTLVYNDLYYLDRDEIEELLRQNPYYRQKFIKKEKEEKERAERQRRLEQGILDRIPDNPIDLFPLARKMRRKWVLHIGPTNSGKTYSAMQALKEAPAGIYLGPLRLLAFECFEKLNNDGVPCSLVTGEEERLVEGATHTASTIEILDTAKAYDVAVIDEAQMACDEQRGGAWTTALLGVRAAELHICAAPQAENLLLKLAGLCGDEAEVIRHERATPLTLDGSKFNVDHMEKSVRKHDALIVFSKWKVLAVAADLQHRGIPCSVVYGSLPYEVRQNEAKRFASGETDVVVATDAIGMGMNLPIQRVVFLEQRKFDGKEDRLLRPEEIRQIAGRAGRKGIFEEGFYTGAYDRKRLKNALVTKAADLQSAYLGFTQNLISIEGKLSEIMEKWMEMENPGLFKKADLEEQLSLCQTLESYSDDKKLIYQFIMIPFDTKQEDLKRVWLNAFLKEMKGEHLAYIPPKYGYELNSLEDAYKYCDLMYYYIRRFSDNNELPAILECKKEIAGKINKLLSEQKIPGKKCKYCGKSLPWNYPYSMCERCHDEMYPRRYGWDDYDDDWY